MTSIEDAYKPEFKLEFEMTEYGFTVTLYNMNYGAESAGFLSSSLKFLEKTSAYCTAFRK